MENKVLVGFVDYHDMLLTQRDLWFANDIENPSMEGKRACPKKVNQSLLPSILRCFLINARASIQSMIFDGIERER